MSQTLMMSPQAYAALIVELQRTGNVSFGHVTDHLGFKVHVSKDLPPGASYLVQDLAHAAFTTVVPEMSLAWARVLAPVCDLSVVEHDMGFRYVIILRQGGRELGSVSVPYEDTTVWGAMRSHLQDALRGDQVAARWVLHALRGPATWHEVELST